MRIANHNRIVEQKPKRLNNDRHQQLMEKVREWETKNPQRHLINERVVIPEKRPDLLELAKLQPRIKMNSVEDDWRRGLMRR